MLLPHTDCAMIAVAIMANHGGAKACEAARANDMASCCIYSEMEQSLDDSGYAQEADPLGLGLFR